MLVGICRRQIQLGSQVNLDIRDHLSPVVMGVGSVKTLGKWSR